MTGMRPTKHQAQAVIAESEIVPEGGRISPPSGPLFLSRPTLDLLLKEERLVRIRRLLREDESHREAGGGVAGVSALAVLNQAAF